MHWASRRLQVKSVPSLGTRDRIHIGGSIPPCSRKQGQPPSIKEGWCTDCIEQRPMQSSFIRRCVSHVFQANDTSKRHGLRQAEAKAIKSQRLIHATTWIPWEQPQSWKRAWHCHDKLNHVVYVNSKLSQTIYCLPWSQTKPKHCHNIWNCRREIGHSHEIKRSRWHTNSSYIEFQVAHEDQCSID